MSDSTFTANDLLHSCEVQERMSGAGLDKLYATFDELVTDQDERLSSGGTPSRLPLLWVALAEAVGLSIDSDGRIIDGPRAHVTGLD